MCFASICKDLRLHSLIVYKKKSYVIPIWLQRKWRETTCKLQAVHSWLGKLGHSRNTVLVRQCQIRDFYSLGSFLCPFVWRMVLVQLAGYPFQKRFPSSVCFSCYFVSEKSPPFVEFMNKNYPPGFTYADFAQQFRAEFFDPNHWAEILESSGAKYATNNLSLGYIFWRRNHFWWWSYFTDTSSWLASTTKGSLFGRQSIPGTGMPWMLDPSEISSVSFGPVKIIR